ncbi:MAG TPA: flagella basal body P-ring formation protein FlgA [Novosphingobium sp.]
MTLRLTVFLAAAALPVAAFAAPFADPAAIDREVAAFTGVPQGQPGGAALPVDRRLRLAACGSPLSIGWHAQRRETVLVQCPDAGGWRVFVPVMAAQGVAAAAPAVLRGEAVTISVAGDGFTVSQPGEAMEAGAVGSWIRVRLAQAGIARGEPMRAQIVRPGLVSVPMP